MKDIIMFSYTKKITGLYVLYHRYCKHATRFHMCADVPQLFQIWQRPAVHAMSISIHMQTSHNAHNVRCQYLLRCDHYCAEMYDLVCCKAQKTWQRPATHLCMRQIIKDASAYPD